jgi:hypothetical protein
MTTPAKILTAVASAAFAIVGMDKLVFHDKPDPTYLSVVLIIIALAIGFDCVVKAIKGRE